MKDNFSSQAKLYAQYRPTYPPELFKHILKKVSNYISAWDCGTGNGQVAAELAMHFAHVEASDISQKQLDNAVKLPNINYKLSSAESTPYPDNHFDLITVAQAIHWFDFDRFFGEVERVAKPGSTIAVWGYGLMTTEEPISQIIHDFHYKTTGPYWDEERKHVDNGYVKIPFPFKHSERKLFEFKTNWTLDQLGGYFKTRSAVQHFITKEGYDPVDAFINKIKPHWPKVSKTMEFIFPVFLTCGIIDK